MGLHEAAAADFDLALALIPQDPGALCGMALAQAARKLYAEAEDIIRKAAAAAPRAPYVYLAMAFIYHQQEKSTGRRQALDQARMLDNAHFSFMLVPDLERIILLCGRFQRKVVIWTQNLTPQRS